MAGHCEALLLGKQQKMSKLMSSQKKQEYGMNVSSKIHNDDLQEMTPDSHMEVGSHMVLSGYITQITCVISITS